jgi:hypothetical protein
MGLLDDAIREHLELKRKHGADLEAVARQEKEALGPGPRAEFAQPDAQVEETPPAAFVPEPEPARAPEPAPEPEPAPQPPPVVEQPTAEHPAPPPATAEHVLPPPATAEHPAPPPATAEHVLPPPATAEHAAPPPATAEHAAPPPAHDDSPWLDDEPDEVPADEALERRRDPSPTGEEDVLEETPDFLQETPEHDRLWFEQKPPRDFDWDK